MNMHLSQTFSSHRAHFFPHRPTNQCRSSRASKRTTYTRRNNAEGKRGKRRMTTFQPPRITFQMNRPPRGPLFVFNISPVARAFLYFSIPPARPLFPVRPSRLSSPLFVIRAPMFNFARSLAISNGGGSIRSSKHLARDVQNKSFINSIPRNPILSIC